MDLPFLDFVSLLLEFFSDIGVGDGSIQSIVLADVARFLDGVVQPALMLGANARYAARHDLGPLRNELRQQFHVFVIDGINTLDTKLTNLLPPVVLLLTRRTLFSG